MIVISKERKRSSDVQSFLTIPIKRKFTQWEKILSIIPDKFSAVDLMYKISGQLNEHGNQAFAEIYAKVNAQNIDFSNESVLEGGLRVKPNFIFDKNCLFFRLKMKNFLLYVNSLEREINNVLFGDDFQLFRKRDEVTNFLQIKLKKDVSLLVDKNFQFTVNFSPKIGLVSFTIPTYKILQLGKSLKFRDLVDILKFSTFVRFKKTTLGLERKQIVDEDDNFNIFASVCIFNSQESSISLVFRSNITCLRDCTFLLNLKKGDVQFCFAFDKEGIRLISLFVHSKSIKKILEKNRCIFVNHEIKDIKTREVKYA